MHQPPAAPSADTARAEIDALYTPLDEALAQLHQRRADEKIRVAVTEFQRACPPTFLPSESCAIFSRCVITPNREFELFVSMAKATGLVPLCLEYTEDILCARNSEKYCLCRPAFEVRPDHFRGLRVINFGQMEGQRLCDMRLASGMTLPEFHHALLNRGAPEINGHLKDFWPWFSVARRHEFYYLHYLALFLRDGILFENFLADDPEELRFARERVIPSFAKAVELFGVRPLIVPLLPRDKESFIDCERWRSYAGALFPEALRLSRKSR
jgi:hypothetical protein